MPNDKIYEVNNLLTSVGILTNRIDQVYLDEINCEAYQFDQIARIVTNNDEFFIEEITDQKIKGIYIPNNTIIIKKTPILFNDLLSNKDLSIEVIKENIDSNKALIMDSLYYCKVNEENYLSAINEAQKYYDLFIGESRKGKRLIK